MSSYTGLAGYAGALAELHPEHAEKLREIERHFDDLAMGKDVLHVFRLQTAATWWNWRSTWPDMWAEQGNLF